MASLIADRYEEIRLLGEGGLSRVVLVRDTQSGQLRALKQLRARDAATAGLVRNEYAALARVRHENVVRVHEFGVLPTGEPYFTMDYIEGRPIDEAIRPGDVPRALAASLQALAGLAALHAGGRAHCDIKPDNVLVSEGEDGTMLVRLVDLGFTGLLSDAASEQVRGTPGYAAPELLAGAPYSRESDYYALGATLYRVLSGRAAFAGRDAGAILAAQRRGLPGILALRTGGVPTTLDAPLLGLLSPDARHRSSSIREWAELAKRGFAGSQTAPPSALPRLPHIAEAPLTGRTEVMSTLRSALESTSRARAWILSGPPGSGRTRIAREIAIEAELSGRGAVWFDADHLPTVDVNQTSGSEPIVILDDVDTWPEEAVLQAVICRFPSRGLAVVATQVRAPQAGDAVLRILLGSPTPPAPQALSVGPLAIADAESLLTSVLSSNPPLGLAQQLTDRVGSYPGPFLDELQRSYGSGRLRTDGARWWLDGSPPEHSAGDDTLAPGDSAWRELEPEAQVAAVVRASWPEAATTLELAEIAGIPHSLLVRGLDQLAWRGHLAGCTGMEIIVPAPLAEHARLHATGENFRAIRHNICDRLLVSPGNDESTSAAERQLARGAQELALGDIDRARASIGAAFHHAKLIAHGGAIADHAAQLLSQMVQPGDAHGAELLAEIARFESDRNRGDRAEQLWQRAISALSQVGTDRWLGWTIERAENLQAVNRFEEAHSILDRALETEPGTPLSPLLLGRALSARGWCRQRLNRSAESFADFEAAQSIFPPDADADRAAAMNRLGFAIARQGDPERGQRLLDEALELAVRSGDPRIEARVRGNRGALASDRGDLVLADSETRAAMSLMSDAGSTQWQFVGATNLLGNASARSDWPAWDLAYAALESVGRTSGNPIAFARASHSLINRSLRQGRITDAARAVRSIGPWVRNIAPSEFAGRHDVFVATVESLRGSPRRARRLLARAYRRARSADQGLVAYYVLCPLAELELADGRLASALRVAKKAWASKYGSASDLIGAGLAIAHTHARRGDTTTLSQFVAEAIPIIEKLSRAGVRDADAARLELLSLEAALSGDQAVARDHWTTAREQLQALDLGPRIAMTEWSLGRIDLIRNRLQQAAVHLREAYQLAHRLGLETWAAHVAQEALPAFEAVEASGSESETVDDSLLPQLIGLVNSLLDFPTLLEDALSMVSERVRADRGFILLGGDAPEDLVEAASYGVVDDESRSSARDVSRSIVRWVTDRGEVFQKGQGVSDPRLSSTQSLLDLSIRSLVCVPLRLRERVIGTIYLESRSEGSQFTEGQVALVESFANLVAVAIENSRFHDDLKRSRDRVISENLSLRRDATRRFGGTNIIGQSVEMERVLSDVARVAVTGVNVLITGPTGSGKELIAKSIHYTSPRANGALVSVNCNALNEGILEAELFGTEKGAATGVVARPGIFERADGGTLFLDEVGDMPLRLQARLLRVLQEREITRVGGSRVHKVDLRIISATFRDLPEMIRAEEFREDLYHRIHQVQVRIPPLNERRVDIPILAEHFLVQFCEKHGRPVPRMSERFLKTILEEPWTGNVRELENYVLRCVVMTDGPVLDPVVTAPSRERGASRATAKPAGWLTPDVGTAPELGLQQALENVEKQWIRSALTETAGNQRQAAELLLIKEPTLRYRMRRLQIEGSAAGPEKPRRHRA